MRKQPAAWPHVPINVVIGLEKLPGTAVGQNLTVVLGILTLLAAIIVFLTLSSRLAALGSISYGVSAILSAIVLSFIGRRESKGFYQSQRCPQPASDEELPHSGLDCLGVFSTAEQHPSKSGGNR